MRSLMKYPESIPFQHEKLREQHDARQAAMEKAKPKSHKEYMNRRRNALERTIKGK